MVVASLMIGNLLQAGQILDTKKEIEVVSLIHTSGQTIATSHDLTPNGGLVREIPLFQGNLGW